MYSKEVELISFRGFGSRKYSLFLILDQEPEMDQGLQNQLYLLDNRSYVYNYHNFYPKNNIENILNNLINPGCKDFISIFNGDRLLFNIGTRKTLNNHWDHFLIKNLFNQEDLDKLKFTYSILSILE